MSIKSIEFLVRRPDTGPDDVSKAVFQLGMGPCGKNVSELEANIKDGMLIIAQETSTYHPASVEKGGREFWVNESKTFAYKMDDVVGRIVTTHVSTTSR